MVECLPSGPKFEEIMEVNKGLTPEFGKVNEILKKKRKKTDWIKTGMMGPLANFVCGQAGNPTQLITTEVFRAGINQQPRHWKKRECVILSLGVKKN